MRSSAVLLTVLLATLLNLLSQSLGDEAKHKKVIIKVPKKINHIHYHHVKKIHVWKHKPKPIHSVHIVEEEEKYWKEPTGGYSKRKQFGGWKPVKGSHKEEEEEYEEEYEDYKKSGSQYKPVVYKGKKSKSSTKKEKRPKFSIGIEGRSKGHSYKGDRAKRQPIFSWYEEEPRNNRKARSRVPPKKSNKSKSRGYDRNVKDKKRPYKPDVYPEYDQYQSRVWPERKEHISWHLRDSEGGEQQQNSDNIFITEMPFARGHPGEINLSQAPDIPVVPSPNLVPKYKSQTESSSYTKSQMYNRKPEYLTEENPKLTNKKPTLAQKKPKLSIGAPPSGLGSDWKLPKGTLAGYTSHVGHNQNGDSSSFQRVVFGEKKKYNYDS